MPLQLPAKDYTLPPFQRSVYGDYDTKLDTPVDVRPNAKQHLGGRIEARVVLNSQSFKVYTDKSRTSVEAYEVRTVFLDLDTTSFGVGTMTMDEKGARGWYLESVNYRAWLQDPGKGADEKQARMDWPIGKEAPDTSNQTGSVSSSIAYTLDGSAGFFGKEVTGNVGGSISIQSSHSHSLTDFTFFQHSDAQVLRHEIRMTMAADGTSYSVPDDLLETTAAGNVVGAFGAVIGGVLGVAGPYDPEFIRQLPGMAKSNVPVVGQAVWMSNGKGALVDKLNLQLSMKARYILLKAWGDPGVQRKYSIAEVTFDEAIPLDFSLLS